MATERNASTQIPQIGKWPWYRAHTSRRLAPPVAQPNIVGAVPNDAECDLPKDGNREEDRRSASQVTLELGEGSEECLEFLGRAVHAFVVEASARYEGVYIEPTLARRVERVKCGGGAGLSTTVVGRNRSHAEFQDHIAALFATIRRGRSS